MDISQSQGTIEPVLVAPERAGEDMDDSTVVAGALRTRELARLSRLLDLHWTAAAVGRTGTGKRAILRRIEAGWDGTVIRVPSSRSESTSPLSGVEILLAAVGTTIEPAGGSSTTAITDRVISALSATESSGGLLITIADADELDESSQSVLGQVIRRLSSGRVRILISARSITDDGPLGPIPSVELRDLDQDELIALAHRLPIGPICPEAAQVAASTAAGRPVALRHILTAMSRSERCGESALTVPVRTGLLSESMMWEIIGSSDPEALAVLGLLSLAPFTLCLPLADRLSGFWEIVDDLETHDIVERRGAHVQITHPLVRSWAHRSMSPRERRDEHERMAEDCVGIDAVLEHWHRSFTQPTGQSAPELIDDGVRLIRRGVVEAGIEFIERALRIGGDAEAAAPGLIAAAEALGDRGEFVFAGRYARTAAGAGATPIMVRARTLEVRMTFARTQALPSHLLRSWSRRELAEAPAEVVRLQIALCLYRVERGERAEAEELLAVARTAANHLSEGDRRLLDAAEIRIDGSKGLDGSALDGFEALRSAEPDEIDPEFVLAVAAALMMTEHYETARAALATLGEQRCRGTIWQVQADCLRAEIAIRAGHVRQAVELIDALDPRDSGRSRVRRDRTLALVCWRLLVSGRAGDAVPIEAQLAATATGAAHRRLLAELNAVQGHFLLRSGLPADAVRHLQRCAELASAEVNPNALRYEADLIAALIEVGRREHAGLLVRALRKRVERCRSRWAELALGRCEALLAVGEKSSELFNGVLRSFGPQDSQLEKARTHAAFATRLNEIGSGPRATEQHLAAAAILAELGAERLIADPQHVAEAHAAPELEELRALSEDELKIVELVRAGLKNKEIARRVFVSLRTVELRLTAVYRKLDVGSRTELVSRLAGNPRLAAV